MDADWTAAVAAFLASIQDISGSTSSYKVYASILRRFADDSPRGFAGATRGDVQAFLNAPSHSRRNYGQPVGASAKNLRLTVLASFFRYASAYQVAGQPLYQKPLPTTGIPYLRLPKPYRGMTAEEFEAILAVIPTDTLVGLRDYVLYFLYFATGRRKSELQRLTWGDIETVTTVDEHGAEHTIRIYRYYGKGASTQIRAKELPPLAYRLLLLYLERADRLSTMRPESPLFPAMTAYGYTTDRPLSGQQIYNRFKYYVQLAHLDAKRITLHSVRHACARWRFEQGQSLFSIQSLLDHSSVSVTDAYLRRLVGVDDPASALLEKRFGHLSNV